MSGRYFIHKDALPKGNDVYIPSSTPLKDGKFVDVEDVFIHSDDCPHSPYYEGLSAYYMQKSLFNSCAIYSRNNTFFTDQTSALGLVYKGQIVNCNSISGTSPTGPHHDLIYIFKLTRDTTGQYIKLTKYSRSLQQDDRDKNTIKVSYTKGADLTTVTAEHSIVTDGQSRLLLELGAAGGGGGGSTRTNDSAAGGGGASLIALLHLHPGAELYVVVGCNGSNQAEYGNRAVEGGTGFTGACSAICVYRDELISSSSSSIILEGGTGGSLSSGGLGGTGYWGEQPLDNYVNRNLIVDNSKSTGVGILVYRSGGNGGGPGVSGSDVKAGSYYLLSSGSGGANKLMASKQTGGSAVSDGGGGGGASLFGEGGGVSNELQGGIGSYGSGGGGRNQKIGGRRGTVGGAGWCALYK